MSLLQNKINAELLEKLQPIIAEATQDCLNQVFGESVTPAAAKAVSQTQDTIITHTSLWEGIDTFDIYIAFEKQFLKTALKAFHDDATLESDQFASIAEDAACELVNIICNQIKTFMNDNGFQFIMMFPSTDLENETPDTIGNDAMITAGFTDNTNKSAIFVSMKA